MRISGGLQEGNLSQLFGKLSILPKYKMSNANLGCCCELEISI